MTDTKRNVILPLVHANLLLKTSHEIGTESKLAVDKALTDARYAEKVAEKRLARGRSHGDFSRAANAGLEGLQGSVEHLEDGGAVTAVLAAAKMETALHRERVESAQVESQSRLQGRASRLGQTTEPEPEPQPVVALAAKSGSSLYEQKKSPRSNPFDGARSSTSKMADVGHSAMALQGWEPATKIKDAAVTEAAARLRQRLAELKAKAAAVPPAELAFEQGTKLAELERQASFDTARTASPESRTLSGGAVQPAAPSAGGDAAGTDEHNGEGDGGGLERLTSVATEFSDDAYEGSMLEQASFASMSTTSDVADVTELGGFRDEVPQNDQGDTAVEDLDEGGGGGGSAAAKEEAAPPKS